MHLFLGTQVDNMKDMVEKGRSPDNAGENNPGAMLDENAVRIIRKTERREVAYRRLASLYGVSVATIKDVVYGRTWREVRG